MLISLYIYVKFVLESCGVLIGELYATKIIKVYLSVFVYRLFYEDFSSIVGTRRNA